MAFKNSWTIAQLADAMSIKRSDMKALIRGRRGWESEEPYVILAILAFCWTNDLNEDDFFIIEPKTGTE